MVHFFSQSFNYDHPWLHVTNGIWHKYPNSRSSHVVSVDVIDRSIDPHSGVVRTERVLGCKQAAPGWVVKLLGGSEDAFVREVSFVDPQTSRTTLISENLSLSQYMTVLEQITYEPSPADRASRTQFRQTAEIQARPMGLIWKAVGERLEAWSAQRFGDNARNGREGFENVLRVLWERKLMVQAEEL
ncbi:hypothetical protein BOTBODRAFT_100826 [Botryobasidium botryosum FD-172 SS1]|uniref:PRELI/MSF1 domain-containing protein n=1 Tax=Botryobasidium botryosum (strain FD-172 SS1) TaxID=930990 RepID=A0A067N8I0_BOTB1|nr:hypothetical protein BOTBODRAFT_100826 [Botryobasidium botryosum FD-172 SS1]